MVTAELSEDGQVNLRWSSGEAARVGFVGKDATETAVDLTGYTARCVIRRCVDGEVLFELDGTGGGAVVDTPETSGRVVVEYPLTLCGICVYGVTIVPATGSPTEIARGSISVNPPI